MRNGNGKRAPAETTSKVVRCAIYTRKSTDEGLNQDFNSLDAQREAAEAFIASQRGEGWQLLPDRYDDGGFSGGDMERPALKRLLVGIEARKVDCVVVYKVDRLSRSLLDFARIMESFDRHGVSFVSVTQQFNTTTSLGRLTLNILLSFAQFEREIISERTRDKMCAARRKGKWVGGHPVLGYAIDPRGGKLLVNPDEARQVRKIFDLYLEHEALLPVLQEVERRHWRMKRWTTKDGLTRGGKPFTKGALHALLTNVIYTGKVDHKGTIYTGEHEPIIASAVWEQVQKTLRRNGRPNGAPTRNRYGALLRGLLYCVPCGAAMIHSYTARKSKRYRYYVCYQAQQRGWKNCESKSVSAPAIETAVLDSIRRLGADPALAAETARQARAQLARRVAEAELEQAAAQKQLRQLNAELVELAGDGAMQSSERLDRLVWLQKEVHVTEQRLAGFAEELQELRNDGFDEQDLLEALERFDPVWSALTAREQARLVHLLIEKVGYDGRKGKVTVSFRSAGLKELCNNDTGETKTQPR
jgi:site-specific DNA recombinase